MARRSEVRCLLFLCIRNEVRHEALSFRLGHVAEEVEQLPLALSGDYEHTTKNKRTKPEKLELKKFDPVVRQHVLYKEAKIK